MKILAIQFRYLGDGVLMTPALRALKEQWPDCELHVLVAEELAPLLGHLPWLSRVWAFPRTRGKAGLRKSWPVIRALRLERFDRSVDFSGNDRGALLSRLCGAPERLAPLVQGGFFGRRFCYTQTISVPITLHQAIRNVRILSAWGIEQPRSLEMEIQPDPALASPAAELMPRPAVVCHLATSQPKKEWPVLRWVEFQRLAGGAGIEVIFSSGAQPREQNLVAHLRQNLPGAVALPPLPDLGVFLAVLKRARAFIAGDTGPLHFAAALGVPTLGLFGPSPAERWAPLGPKHRFLQARNCACPATTSTCLEPAPCMASIQADAVLSTLGEILEREPAPDG